MQKKRIIGTTNGILVIGAALLLAQTTSWLTGTGDQKFDKLAGIQPGLGTVMIEYAKRFGNVYYAAQAGNWGMAAYQLKEAVEIQEVAETTRPARKALLQGFESNALVPLANDIVKQNLDGFKRDFSTMVTMCNGCHAATGFSYIVYKLPDRPKVPAKLDTGQKFTTQELQTILADLVGGTPAPAITSGGIVNGASFALAPAPVAPGSIISIFGTNLAASTAQASAVPLPTQLAGITVKVNGTPIPLFFVSPGQINAQLPFEAPPGRATAVVTSSAGDSRSETFNVASSAIGIFPFPSSNRAIALNQDGSVNGPENPEGRGRVIVVFLTGQGPVTPPVPTGRAAPLDTLSPAALPGAATIGGSTAPVMFLGLTPGFVGLAQANIQIPSDITPGAQVAMSITVGGQAGNTTTISVK
ncbi:MAG: hypothetical protein HY238_18500 [Acidobacteria bacterium]|nr:hypothetical protein [Acidobacteriota bacterium]